MIFNYDWWFGGEFKEKTGEARRRCALNHFPDLEPKRAAKDDKFKKFINELEARTIVYLRDGFSYEIKEIIKTATTGSMTFECMAADEAYKVGCFVVTVPFDDIVRVEVFAVHPNEKPEDMPAIKGFGSGKVPPASPHRPDDRPHRPEPTE